MSKRRESTVNDGAVRIIRDQTHSFEEALELVRSITEECPTGFHPLRAVVQKDRGRRVSVEVSFKRNAGSREGTE